MSWIPCIWGSDLPADLNLLSSTIKEDGNVCITYQADRSHHPANLPFSFRLRGPRKQPIRPKQEVLILIASRTCFEAFSNGWQVVSDVFSGLWLDGSDETFEASGC